jgi:hypothetical protein
MMRLNWREKRALEGLQPTLPGKCSCEKLRIAEEPLISKAARSLALVASWNA